MCPFEVRQTFSVNQEVVTSFSDADGNLVRQIVTGYLTTRLENLSTGKTIHHNISGPATITFETDQGFDGPFDIVGRGLGAQPFFPGDHPSSTLLLFSGRARLHMSGPPDFWVTLLSHTGDVTYLCALLA